MYSATFGMLWSLCTSTFMPFFSVFVATGNCFASFCAFATPANPNTQTTAAVVCVLGFAGVANAQNEAKQFPVATKTLKNGMKVLVQSDHSIPNVALYIFYRIGSRNEHPGTTGLSHFFEHMMFNGAKKYGPGERRLRTDNDNSGLLDEQLWATAFIAHPYQWPVVGWMSDIEHWTMEDLKHHFEMGYSPSNATMVIAGDVTSDEIFQLCEKFIEPIPTHAPPPPVTTVEPEQLGERRLAVHKTAELPLLMIGYHVPQTNTPEFYALNILRTVLFQGESSRMYQRLVDKDQIALDVSAFVQPSFDPTLAIVVTQPKQGIDPAKCETAIYEEFDKAKSALISDQELEKAKNIRLVEFYHQMRTINGRANTIGTYEVFFGDYNRLFDAAKNYSAVTKEDVQRVAKTYFGADNRTVATLIPENAEKAKQ